MSQGQVWEIVGARATWAKPAAAATSPCGDQGLLISRRAPAEASTAWQNARQAG